MCACGVTQKKKKGGGGGGGGGGGYCFCIRCNLKYGWLEMRIHFSLMSWPIVEAISLERHTIKEPRSWEIEEGKKNQTNVVPPPLPHIHSLLYLGPSLIRLFLIFVSICGVVCETVSLLFFMFFFLIVVLDYLPHYFFVPLDLSGRPCRFTTLNEPYVVWPRPSCLQARLLFFSCRLTLSRPFCLIACTDIKVWPKNISSSLHSGFEVIKTWKLAMHAKLVRGRTCSGGNMWDVCAR